MDEDNGAVILAEKTEFIHPKTIVISMNNQAHTRALIFAHRLAQTNLYVLILTVIYAAIDCAQQLDSANQLKERKKFI